jgi:SOS-response transcriptional repressor LexA
MLTIPENKEETVTYELTDQQERVWKQMRLLQSLNGGRPATQGEISKALGFKSKQGCAVHFEALSSMGYIVCTKTNGWRCWLAVDPDPTREVTVYSRGRGGRFKNGKNYIPDEAKFDTSQVFEVDGQIVSGGPTEEEGFSGRLVETWRVMYKLQSLRGGAAATQSQISKSLGMSSMQGARSHLARLSAAGYVIHTNRKWYAVIPKDKASAQTLLTYDGQTVEVQDFTEDL